MLLFEAFLALIALALVVCVIADVRHSRKRTRKVLDGQSVSGPHRPNRWL